MSYRVETASSGRAGCKQTECKKEGAKIEKGELRFGVWVDFPGGHGGWQWRHWGCISGKQIQNIRNNLQDPDAPEGTYRWDFLDGYEGEENNSLDKTPDLQAKVRRVIEQGFVDPEDFNGDPEMNKLGETGLRTPATKQKMRDAEKAEKATERLAELEAQLDEMSAERDDLIQRGKSTTELDSRIQVIQNQLDAFSKKMPSTPSKKRVKKRAKNESDGEEEEKPAKKKRATKAKKEVDEDGEEVKPAKKSRAKKVKKEEEETESEEEDVKPVSSKRSRAKKIKNEEEAEDAEDVKPAKKPRAKKVKKEEEEAEREEENVKRVPAKKPRAKKAMKEEDEAEDQNEEEDIKLPPAKKARAKKVKKEEAELAENEEDAKPAPAKKPRAKKGVKAEPEPEAISGYDDAAPPKKATTRRKKVKDEATDEQSPSAKAAPKKSRKKAVKAEPEDDANLTAPDIGEASDFHEELEGSIDTRMANAGSSFKGEDKDDEEEFFVPPRKGKGAKSKKGAATGEKAARASRSKKVKA